MINGTTQKEPTADGIDKPNQIKSLPEGKYTIKIATFDQNFDVNSYLNKTNLNKDDLYTYNTNSDINVLYGSFDKLADAKELFKSMDKSLINSDTYIDLLEKHRKLFQKYKTNN